MASIGGTQDNTKNSIIIIIIRIARVSENREQLILSKGIVYFIVDSLPAVTACLGCFGGTKKAVLTLLDNGDAV